jgi:hypothetical protein
MIEEHAKSFPLPCMECGDRIEIELPEGAETREAGTRSAVAATFSCSATTA